MTNANLTLLRNARLYGGRGAHDLRLREGRVDKIAPAGTLAAERGETIDLAGRYLGPGLWDEHVHFTQWVIQRRRFDLSDTASSADVLVRVRAALEQSTAPAGRVVTGYGFRDALWPDAPTLVELDRVAPDRPVVLVSGDLHCGWLNSRAAARLGVEVGESGLLREGPWMAALSRLDEGAALSDGDYRGVAAEAARRGVVGVVEFENADNVHEWPARVAAGVSSLRVEASIWPDRLQAAVAQGLRTGTPLDPQGLVTVGRLKVIVDGSLNTRTAWCWEPYVGVDPHSPHACGLATVPISELRRLLQIAEGGGLAASVHAIGDRANTEVIDTFDELGMPGVIEHAQLVRSDDFPRFARLGLVASVQPEHAMDDRDVADRLWADRTDRAFAFASLHAAGATLQFGSDAPVAPLDPWLAIATAVSRSRDGRQAWHAEQRLPLELALAASSRGRVRVAAGDPADLVILDADPFDAPPEQLRRMPVAGTLLGGRWTWKGW